MKEYEDFTECYYDLVKQVYLNNEHESAPRGLRIKETLGVTFAIKNPLNRLLYIPERGFSLTYAIAEILWYSLGENSTKWISNYSNFWSNISDDGLTANSAYGARMFKPHFAIARNRIVQWDYVYEELKRDPDSRRAVIHIRTPDDSVDAKLDVPCTLSMQFFIRNGKLDMVVNMRSSDLIFGISYDIPAFTYFQELLALRLGIQVGKYMHMSNSLHIYERHFDMCEKILAGESQNKLNRLPMPQMKETPNFDMLNKLQNLSLHMDTQEKLEALINYSKLFFTNMNLPIENDWISILLSNQAKKLKLQALKTKLITETTFEGFHAFT
jgi:thymidylate synthase